MPPPSSPLPGQRPADTCKHTVVRVVSRSDDAEFVECQSCGEIFDSIEYEDMAREDALREAGDDDVPPSPAPRHGAVRSKPSRPPGKHRR